MSVASRRAEPARVALRYEVPRSCPDWTLPQEPVPESQTHDITLDLLKALLLAWVARTGLSAQVARNLAVRWDQEHPNVGVDPDLCVIVPRTPEGDDLESLCSWKPGHGAPRLAIEVVSPRHPHKDYAEVPERYAACGVGELWIFDPHLAGPKAHGGPVRIQLWRRSGETELERLYAGDGPVRSEAVGGWLFGVCEGKRLRIADDEAGTSWWTTAAEAERAEKERAFARILELEERLRSAGGG
jgi:Uma2 family endonuclease